MPEIPNGQTDYEKWYAGLRLPDWLRRLVPEPVPIARVKEPPAPTGAIAQPTWGAGQILGKYGIEPKPLATFAPPTPAELVRAAKEADAVDLTGGVKMPVRYETITEGGWVYSVGYDEDGKVVSRDPLGRSTEMTAYEEARLGLEERGQAGWTAPTTGVPTDAYGRTATWNQRLGQWDYPPNWGQRPGDQPEPIPPSQLEQWEWEREQALRQFRLGEQQFGTQQQFQEQQLAQQQAQFQANLQFQQAQAQAAQEEQERRYMSQLAAQPISWLQYAAYTGQQPVIQPWMKPLGFQDTGGAVMPQVGQPIPGFQGQAGEKGIQSFANLPQLRTPSAQLQASWGPTAQAQWLGYKQARTGATPEESQFRSWSQRAPTGRFTGFSRFR